MSLQVFNRPDAVLSIAPKLGIDLSRAIRAGRMTPQDLSAMMRHCALCWHSRKCAQWERRLAAGTETGMPAFCDSREALNALAAEPAPGTPAG